MTTVRQDTFQRANVVSGWGTATDGNAWTIQSGNSQSVTSDEGVISGSTSSTFATLGAALTSVDAEGLVRWDVGALTSGSNAGILLRWTNSSNHWLARWSEGSGLQVMVKVSGTYTTLGTTAVTVTAGTFYWLRFRAQGTTISVKHWQDGTTEPSGWTAQYTNSSQNVAGMAGLYGYAASTTLNYDTYSVNDLASTAHALSGTVGSGSSLSGSLTVEKPLAGTVSSGVGASGTLTVVAPTGIGDITRTTGTQTANKSGNGYGSGDLTGTEYDYAYTDKNGSGWAIGVNPWYGGMPVSAWYQVDPGLNTTLPQKTSATGNLMTLLTTQSGGIVHWEEGVAGTFAASELPTFQSAGNFSELAPANTPFRAYVKCIGDANDANGIAWTAYACIYPGDPGFVVFRLDQHNPSASAITFSESDIELIASLLGDTGANPTGVWQIGNGYVNTIGNATPTQWSNPGSAQVGTFDYAWVTPDTSQSTITLGTGAVVLQSPQSQFGWEASSKYEVNDSGPNATKPTRIKFGWYSPTISYALAAGATNTYYVLRVFSRGLTQARMDAIAADFKYPGTPTATVGSFTSFSVDERAYVFASAASSNHLTATLDLSPAHVTARYKPIIKVTGWTGSAAPTVTWGGAALVLGTDYRYTVDTANGILYLQLYCDVVASGATAGQRNNAALDVSGAQIALGGSVPSGAGLSGSLTVAKPLAGTVASGSGVASAFLHVEKALAGAVGSGVALHATLTIEKPLRGTVGSGVGASGTLSTNAAPGPAVITLGTPQATATISVGVSATATITAGSTP